MSLIGFHRLLIATAIVFCGGFALWQFRAFAADGAPVTLLIGIAFVVAAAGLVYYLRNLPRFLGRSGETPPNAPPAPPDGSGTA